MNIIINYKIGNTGSIINIIKKIGYEVKLSDNQRLFYQQVNFFTGVVKVYKQGLLGPL